MSTRVNIDDWVDDPAWQARVPIRERWHSTNHLMGRGYWFWLIPLGNGSTSLGIVADATIHDWHTDEPLRARASSGCTSSSRRPARCSSR